MQAFRTYIDSGLIPAADLVALLDARNRRIKLIDATYILPGMPGNPFEEFRKRRIDDAVFFDVDEIADRSTDLPHMLPTAAEFSRAVTAMGIGNDDFVVVYSQSGIPMAAPRVWWTFRVFGHDAVCVLDGGLPAWIAAGNPVNESPPAPPAPSSGFSTRFRPELVNDRGDVKAALTGEYAIIMDARPPGRFAGIDPEPRPGLHRGRIPGSVNIPAASLVSSDTLRLKSPEELKLTLGMALDTEKQVIATCGSGVTACMIAFALYNMGNKRVSVYDGAWAEWGKESADLPVAARC